MLEAFVVKPKIQFEKDMTCSPNFALSFRILLANRKGRMQKALTSYWALGLGTAVITTNLEPKLSSSTCLLSSCGRVPPLTKSHFSHLRKSNHVFNNKVLQCLAFNTTQCRSHSNCINETSPPILFYYFILFYFIFLCSLQCAWARGQSNPCHSSHHSQNSDNARSLTH